LFLVTGQPLQPSSALAGPCPCISHWSSTAGGEGVSALSRMTGDFGIGMGCCVVAAFGFGSNYLPVKQLDCGDGFFFAAMMAIGITSVGVMVNYSELTTGPFFDGPRFEPWAMVGGAAWMMGNLMTPTIIRLLGLGIGLSIWDLSNMVTGWATGNFGLFGVWKETVACPWMNYLGVALAGVSLMLFAQAMEEPSASSGSGDAQKQEQEKEVAAAEDDVVGELEHGRARAGKSLPSMGTTDSTASTVASIASTSNETDIDITNAGLEEQEQGDTATSTAEEPTHASPEAAAIECDKHTEPHISFAVSARGLQILGFAMAIAAGLLFGSTFDTAMPLMQDGRLGGPHSPNSMDYVLSNFCGILAMALASLLVYVLVRRRRSYTPRKLVLPSIVSGVMWGVAQAAWFRANAELSVVVAFPIVSSLPGLVALAWGFFCFDELRSTRSRRFAAAGLAFRLPSVLLIALSDQVR